MIEWSFRRGLACIVLQTVLACGGTDGQETSDAGPLRSDEACDLVESTVCEKVRMCDEIEYPECEADWRDLCCEDNQQCDGVTSTTLADIDVCIADIIEISCQDLDENGQPSTCDGFAAPTPDAGVP